MLVYRDVTELLSDYLDQALPVRSRLAVPRLFSCKA
jgi:hypothetical protein